MRFSYGRVAFFQDFGHCKMRCCFGCVLGGAGGRFSEIFGRFWVDFGVFYLLILEYLFKEPQMKSKGTPKEKLMCFHTKLEFFCMFHAFSAPSVVHS